MNTTVLVVILFVGMALGVIAHRTRFCVFGALVEWFEGAGTRRLMGVLAAVGVFALIHLWGFKGNPPCTGSWGEYAGLHSIIGGLLQGIGYVLIAGCPLSLCVRIGQGSKYHLAAAIGFAVGVAAFAQASSSLLRLFEPFIYTGGFSLLDLLYR